MQLLFKDEPEFPGEERITEVFTKHLGELDKLGCTKDLADFAVKRYLAEFKDAKVPPTINMFACVPFEDKFDEMQKSQMWDCLNERDRILGECRYMILASDMLAATLPANERAELDMDYLEALLELFPECEAVFFQNSEKLLTADYIRNAQIGRRAVSLNLPSTPDFSISRVLTTCWWTHWECPRCFCRIFSIISTARTRTEWFSTRTT